MPPSPTADDPDGSVAADAFHDQLCHDLKTPLTVILGRSHLLARALRRSPSLAEGERVTMLTGLTHIDAAVLDMVLVIDQLPIEHLRRDDHDPPAPEQPTRLT